ncbi:MAG: CCC motif membrane protein [Salibacteraceae bacterium]
MEVENDTLDQAAPSELPNAVAVLVLGISSIATCMCYGVPGLALGIVALVMAQKSRKLYFKNPGSYSKNSYGNLNAGYICAIIGTIFSGLFVLFIVGYVIFFLAILGKTLGELPINQF